MKAVMIRMTSSVRQFLDHLAIPKSAPSVIRGVMVAAVVAFLGSQAAHAGPSVAPEIDPGSAGAALTVLAGSALVLRAFFRAKRKP
jgi:hypothetical protein